ncbi:hypothetical protein Y032_0275g1050 [Ancylostoma ceylanicum]|uniref:Uncharacterized protein n=1 Tax=Ancylostoma ceylanicum TaxID=53326 RepID=A0A016S7L2_9BILA|nr:hypothetical protein Y032_0275g1050 [Ancylostoma ceylanicum]
MDVAIKATHVDDDDVAIRRLSDAEAPRGAAIASSHTHGDRLHDVVAVEVQKGRNPGRSVPLRGRRE